MKILVVFFGGGGCNIQYFPFFLQNLRIRILSRFLLLSKNIPTIREMKEKESWYVTTTQYIITSRNLVMVVTTKSEEAQALQKFPAVSIACVDHLGVMWVNVSLLHVPAQDGYNVSFQLDETLLQLPVRRIKILQYLLHHIYCRRNHAEVQFCSFHIGSSSDDCQSLSGQLRPQCRTRKYINLP